MTMLVTLAGHMCKLLFFYLPMYKLFVNGKPYLEVFNVQLPLASIFEWYENML